MKKFLSLFRINRIPSFGKGKHIWIDGNRFMVTWHSFSSGSGELMMTLRKLS